MTHLYGMGCATPYKAFSVCLAVVSTLHIVEDSPPSCPACRVVYDRRRAELERGGLSEAA